MKTSTKARISIPQSSETPQKGTALIQAILKEQVKDLSSEDLNIFLEKIGYGRSSIEDALSSLRTSLLSDEDKKNHGAVFTPKWLADKVTQTAWQHWNKLHRTGRRVQKVGDISCGTGAFLSSARDFFGNDVSLYGNDTDETSVIFARVLNK